MIEILVDKTRCIHRNIEKIGFSWVGCACTHAHTHSDTVWRGNTNTKTETYDKGFWASVHARKSPCRIESVHSRDWPRTDPCWISLAAHTRIYMYGVSSANETTIQTNYMRNGGVCWVITTGRGFGSGTTAGWGTEITFTLSFFGVVFWIDLLLSGTCPLISIGRRVLIGWIRCASMTKVIMKAASANPKYRASLVSNFIL